MSSLNLCHLRNRIRFTKFLFLIKDLKPAHIVQERPLRISFGRMVLERDL